MIDKRSHYIHTRQKYRILCNYLRICDKIYTQIYSEELYAKNAYRWYLSASWPCGAKTMLMPTQNFSTYAKAVARLNEIEAYD